MRSEAQAGGQGAQGDRQEAQAGAQGDREDRREAQVGDREDRQDRRQKETVCRILLKFCCLMRCISADADIRDAAAGGKIHCNLQKKIRKGYHGKNRGAFK